MDAAIGADMEGVLRLHSRTVLFGGAVDALVVGRWSGQVRLRSSLCFDSCVPWATPS